MKLALLVALALVPLGCKQPKKVQVQQTVEESPRMASAVRMGDPKLETQLVSGFYGIEGNAWRWVAKQFTVVLRPPFGASQRGATLQLSLTVPDPVINKLKTISLSASVDGSPLPPETYTQAGPYVYKRDVPASLLTADSVKVDFQLDKAMPPTDQDKRELGVVVNSVSLEAK
ncbi:MAG TPA: hypothetical protein VG456_18800 [Candidatus Sulfopaludibacter sp.]|jgi:hypothetical protein|nr:hypothetical protein [Candidatus Sulfopaludibacter sp.]